MQSSCLSKNLVNDVGYLMYLIILFLNMWKQLIKILLIIIQNKNKEETSKWNTVTVKCGWQNYGRFIF